jgi:two-component system nitrate/nitrite response regulator NarL
MTERDGSASADPRPASGGFGKVSVFVADDHPLYRQAVVAVLDEHPGMEVVGVGADAREAMAAIAELRPDVALLDMKMPGSGIAVVRWIREARLGTHVVFLSGYTGAREVYAAVSAGARGYVTKDAPGPTIHEAILTVARGATWFSPTAEASLVSAVRDRGDAARVYLTDRERQILQLVSEGRSNAEVGGALHLSPETIKSHLRTIFEKLGATDRTSAVAQALRQSLIT